ncbi:37S ribosomal protein S22, partial [Spiromyces aspiralis]
MVELPKYLINVLQKYIDDKDKRLIRIDALRIADSLRSTGMIQPGRSEPQSKLGSAASVNGVPQKPSGEQESGPKPNTAVRIPSLFDPNLFLEPHVLEYGERETAAYIASRMPATYGVIANVLTEASRRIPWLNPTRVLDFGTGPATALWAMKEVWGDSVKQFTGIDISEPMLQSAEAIMELASATEIFPEVEFKRYLAPRGNAEQYDLVMCAFTLSDLPNDTIRKATVQELWNYTKDTLVIIDRGTPH